MHLVVVDVDVSIPIPDLGKISRGRFRSTRRSNTEVRLDVDPQMRGHISLNF